MFLAQFPEDEHSPQRSIPKSPPPGPPFRKMLCMVRALHLFTAPPLHPADGGRHSPDASQLCSCLRCQTCRTRPEAPPPYQFTPQITAAQVEPPTQRCFPLPRVPSTPRPAAFPPLIPSNRVSVSNHRNPAAPPPWWCSGGNLLRIVVLTRIKKTGALRCPPLALSQPRVSFSRPFLAN